MGKEGTEARDHPASPGLGMLCGDLLPQTPGLRGHALPELGMGLNFKKTALWSGMKQEETLQRAGRGASHVRADPRARGSRSAGFAWFYPSIYGIFQMRSNQLNPGEYTWCALSFLPATKDEREGRALPRQERLHPTDRSWLLFRGVSTDAEVLL